MVDLRSNLRSAAKKPHICDLYLMLTMSSSAGCQPSSDIILDSLDEDWVEMYEMHQTKFSNKCMTF